jgi:aminoglycoside/choline kinase family phosphotransferase
VPLAGDEVGVLDHQDLRQGPPFYDLASLLNDSLYPPPQVEEEIIAPYVRGPEDRLRYRRAAAQRALKIAGTFEAFRRRGHDRHVALIAPSLAAAGRHLAALPETADLAEELAPLWRGQPAAS